MIELRSYIQDVVRELGEKVERLRAGGSALLREQSGQGTTEYAILVGVLVVIAVLAIVTFREKVSSLWEAIASGINSL